MTGLMALLITDGELVSRTAGRSTTTSGGGRAEMRNVESSSSRIRRLRRRMNTTRKAMTRRMTMPATLPAMTAVFTFEALEAAWVVLTFGTVVVVPFVPVIVVEVTMVRPSDVKVVGTTEVNGTVVDTRLEPSGTLACPF